MNKLILIFFKINFTGKYCCTNGATNEFCCTNGATNKECALKVLTTTTTTTTKTTTTTTKKPTTTTRTIPTTTKDRRYVPVSYVSRPVGEAWTGTYRTFVGTFRQGYTWLPFTATGSWRTRKYTTGTFTTTPSYKREDYVNGIRVASE